MSEKVRYTITACISGTSCNFDCGYCYRKKQGVEEKNQPSYFRYSVDYMLKALLKQRLGGIADIIVIGGGETLLHPDVVPFIKGLLAEGHIVEVVTNMTLNHRIDELLDNTPPEHLERLLVKGSFHYLELKRLNKLDDFFNNMKKVVEAGASCFPFLVICEEYIPLLDEIKSVFIENLGELPHCTSALDFTEAKMQPYGFYNSEFKKIVTEKFGSKINDTFDRFLSVDVKKHFCYAGEWSFVLNTSNGSISRCFYSPSEQNIFKDISSEIKLGAIGTNCCIGNCALHYNLVSQGIMPDFDDVISYGDMLYKPKLFNKKLVELLNFKYENYMPMFSKEEEQKINAKARETFEELKTKV